MNEPAGDEPTGDEPPAQIAGATGEEDRRVDVGVVVAHSADRDRDALAAFADRACGDVVDELAASTGAAWRFYAEEPSRLGDAGPHRPAEFLDEAVSRMVRGPYDLVVVVTDVPVLSRRQRRVPALASPLSGVAVLSVRDLLLSRRDEPRRSLDDESVRWNGAALLLHEIGHLLGAGHGDGDGEDAMAPFEFDPSRRSVPDFDPGTAYSLRRTATEVSEMSPRSRGLLGKIRFHLVSVTRNPGAVASALGDSRAPLLPLSLPKLSTAAVAPTLIIVFSAEAWDVGIHMDNGTAVGFTVASLLLATGYLVGSLDLLFPRKRRAVLTEHVALVNVTIVLVLFAAMIGLFALVALVVLTIEFVVFPPQLMRNWPSLEDPAVSVVDLLRVGTFISTIGLLSGALAGGLENRTFVRHLVLFRDEP